MYQKGDRVRTTRETSGAPYSNLENFRKLASSAAVSQLIPAGKCGVVVENIVDLIVSFDEPGIVGRAIDPTAVEAIEED